MANIQTTTTATPQPAITRPQLRPTALPMDLLETDDAFILLANLPGVRKEDLHIDLQNNQLTVSADRHEPLPAGTDADAGDDMQPTPLFRELGGIRWERSFKLSTPIDVEHIDAHLDNGVLQLTLPKAPEARPRKIEIKVG